MLPNYDVIVVGAGHAGCEAAAAAANMGSKTLLITMDMAKFANMSCNPAMGGIAKGQIVREIDALGGFSGIVTDKSMLQFRMLNRSKGPAMWSPRAQCDRMIFTEEWRNILENTPNLDFWQDIVTDIIVEENKIIGVRTMLKVDIYSKSVILTNGTFLNGLMHIGKVQIEGGRASEMSSYGLSEHLEKLGFTKGRMKTGTPARLDGRSIDFSKLIEQKGDNPPAKFSFSTETKPLEKQLSCYITYTDPSVHQVLEKGLKESPLFDGTIQSIGPRYCPSIETKITTFADKDKHLLFLEPEGWKIKEYYLNGFSSSLSLDIQLEAMRKIPGFENLKIYRPGYAIEYDFFDPTQLNHTLETKLVENLYFAGQINGTTGYEEAGAQGLMAGINAHLKNNEKEPFILKRDDAYIGVLIDDLITKGVDEPYRMFTSRAEYRILLRQEDADMRLTERSYNLGLAKKERYELMLQKKDSIQKLIRFFETYSIKPHIINSTLEDLKTAPINQSMRLIKLIYRPQVGINNLAKAIIHLQEFIDSIPVVKDEVIEAAEVLMKYSGYIDRERGVAEKMKRLEHIKIHSDFDYSQLKSLSTEARQKLNRIKPQTIGQASRISGVSPADINVLLIYFGR